MNSRRGERTHKRFWGEKLWRGIQQEKMGISGPGEERGGGNCPPGKNQSPHIISDWGERAGRLDAVRQLAKPI